MKNVKKIPFNLQFFADDPAASAENQTGTGTGKQETPSFDYDKLASLIAGKQTVTEESVLKGYFKQQGLSKEQMEQAIAAFKKQQAESQPDVAGMQGQITEAQNQLASAQKAAQQAQIQSAATLMAVSLGVDTKTVPYVLKMADLSQVLGQDGKINDEALKNAVNKVLEDVPALKPQANGNTGFVQIGTGGNPGQQTQTATAAPQVVSKKWNRWN